MTTTVISANTQAILLLTAPLRGDSQPTDAAPLTATEYRRLARWLHERQRQPADLLGPDAGSLLQACSTEPARLQQLLERGFLLAQALDRWHARSIWVASRADTTYPSRWRDRLPQVGPPILYGCGDPDLLLRGGLAVVGSRNANRDLLDYTARVGYLLAQAGRTVISGGARGIDQAAVRGALDAGGTAVAVLADGLMKAAIHREFRQHLIDGRLVLVSPYDPAAGFQVGLAMSRNKLVYALADAALVVNSDLGEGGTWAGAVEQLEKLRLVPVYVRDQGAKSQGLDGLRRKGALSWPEPANPQALAAVLDEAHRKGPRPAPQQHELWSSVEGDVVREGGPLPTSPTGDSATDPVDHDVVRETHTAPLQSTPSAAPADRSASDQLFDTVRELLASLQVASTEAEIANHLGITRTQARAWLRRLVEDGVVRKQGRPARYHPKRQS